MACPAITAGAGFSCHMTSPQENRAVGPCRFFLFSSPFSPHAEGQVPVCPPRASLVPLALRKAQPGKKARDKPSKEPPTETEEPEGAESFSSFLLFSLLLPSTNTLKQ